MSQKSFLDNKKSRKNFPYVGGGRGGSTNIWKIPYVSSFLFLKASLIVQHFNETFLLSFILLIGEDMEDIKSGVKALN